MRLNYPHLMIALALCSVVLLVPLAVGFGTMGPRMMFDMLAADSMYYMAIANNFSKFGILSFDGVESSNGFHPLWQWMMALGFKWSGMSHHDQIFLVMGASVLFVWLAYVIVSCGLMAMLGTGPGLVASLAMLPGVYSLGFEPRRHYFGETGVLYTLSPYSAMNGMETPLSLLLWAVFFVAFVPRFLRGSEARLEDYFPLSVRLCLPLIILCRLDDCFIMIAIGVFVLLYRGITLKEKIAALVHISWPTAVVLAGYLGFNYYNLGVMLPTSASTKVEAFHHFDFMGFYQLFRQVLPAIAWWGLAVRVVPVMLALIAGTCGAVLALRARYRYGRSAAGDLVFLFCVFIATKAFFIFTSLYLGHQGYWYYFSMVDVMNVMAAMSAGALVQAHKRALEPLAVMLVLLIACRMPNDINMLLASRGSATRTLGDLEYNFWENSEMIKAYLNEHVPEGKLIDTLDGMYAYLLDMPAESVRGFPSSPQELERRRHMDVWTSIVSRGYNLVPDWGGFTTPEMLQRSEMFVAETLQPPGSMVGFARIEQVKK